MNLLHNIFKEYVLFVEHLLQTETVQNNRIIIDRDRFQTSLEKFNYITFKQKTKIYKQLNLIIHDKNNYTMPYKNPKSKKTERKVMVNYDTYITAKHLYETIIKE